MNERRAIFVNLLQVDDELARVVLRVRKDLGSKQSNDVITDDLTSLILEISIVDAEVGVEPVDFVGNQFRRNEALHDEIESDTTMDEGCSYRTLAATSAWTNARCSSLPLNTGVLYPGTFLIRCTEVSLPVLEPGTDRWA